MNGTFRDVGDLCPWVRRPLHNKNNMGINKKIEKKT